MWLACVYPAGEIWAEIQLTSLHFILATSSSIITTTGNLILFFSLFFSCWTGEEALGDGGCKNELLTVLVWVC